MDGAESPGGGAAAGRGGQPLRARAFSQPAEALPGARQAWCWTCGRWDLGGARRGGAHWGAGRWGAWPRRTGPLRDRARPRPCWARSLVWGDWTRPGLPLVLLEAPRRALILLPQGPPGSWAMKQIPGPAPRTTEVGVGTSGPGVQAARSPQRASLGPLSAPSSGVLTPTLPPKPSRSPLPPRTPPAFHASAHSAAHAPFHRWERGGLGCGDTRTLEGRPR